MQKFLRIFALAVIMTFAMSVFVHAAEEITQDTTLVAGKTYTDITVKGNITVTVPEEGVTFSSTQTSERDRICMIIESGDVTLKGGTIYHKNPSISSISLIQVNEGASLTIDDVVIKGKAKANTGIINANEKIYHTIVNKGSLTIKGEKAEISDIETPSGYANSAVISNYGKLVIDNVKIDNFKAARGGYAIIMHKGTDGESSTVINKASIHTPSTSATGSIYHIGGSLTIDDALIIGKINGNYDNNGLYKMGKIADPIGETVFCGVDGLTVSAKKDDILIANPSHEIKSKIGDVEYYAAYTNGQWQFLDMAKSEHRLFIDTKDLYLTDKNKSKGSVVATVICSKADNHKPTLTMNPQGIVNVSEPEIIVRDEKYRYTVTAIKPGKTNLTFTVNGNVQEVCTVHVAEDEVIKDEDKTLEAESTHSDLMLKGDSNGTIITVNGDVYITSNDGDSCITVESGSVTIQGSGRLIFKNDNKLGIKSLIKVKQGAALTMSGGVTLDGGNLPVLYGIDNMGYLIFNNCVVTNVNADIDSNVQNIDEDVDIVKEEGVIFNEGDSIDIRQAVIYGNTGNAIYNLKGNISMITALIAGTFDDSFKLSGNKNFLMGVVSLPAEGTAQITSKSSSGTPLVAEKVKNGETLIAHYNHTVKASMNGKEYNSIYTTGRWDFVDKTTAVVSYVKGSKSKVKNNSTIFGSSHIKENGNKNTAVNVDAESSSVSTAFIKEKSAGASGDVYVLCDVNVPANNVFIKKASKETTNNYTLGTAAVTDTDSSAIYIASAANAQTFKYRFTADGSKEQYGIIIDNLYADGAVAYMRECTEEQYTAATDYTVATAESDTAAVSL